jgi:hypothetical protein
MSLPVALDTNVLVRLLVNDDPAQAEQAAALGVPPAGDGFCRCAPLGSQLALVAGQLNVQPTVKSP